MPELRNVSILKAEYKVSVASARRVFGCIFLLSYLFDPQIGGLASELSTEQDPAWEYVDRSSLPNDLDILSITWNAQDCEGMTMNEFSSEESQKVLKAARLTKPDIIAIALQEVKEGILPEALDDFFLQEVREAFGPAYISLVSSFSEYVD